MHRAGHRPIDLQNEFIRADLAVPNAPTSAPGVLVEALRLRRLRGLPPFTVLSCDNIPENGDVVRNAVLGLATVRDQS